MAAVQCQRSQVSPSRSVLVLISTLNVQHRTCYLVRPSVCLSTCLSVLSFLIVGVRIWHGWSHRLYAEEEEEEKLKYSLRSTVIA